MRKVTLKAYAATFVALVLLDAVWLGIVAMPMYQRGIGHLMAAQPQLAAAAAFYIVYPVGLVVFAVLPWSGAGRTAWRAALFGAIAYATYDLSNLATLRDWPLSLSLVDIAWGAAVSAIAASAGRSFASPSAGIAGTADNV